MAKVTTQSIPSETRILYKRAAQIATTLRGQDYVRGRFPWRLPKMQAGGPDVKPDQQIQRDRFSYVKKKYVPLDAATKARWAAANPVYHSYLFGYNFFMLEGLMGGGPEKYPQMIKSIQVIKQTMSKAGNTGFVCTAVDPAKTVILINGNSYISDKMQRGESSVADAGSVNIALSPNVDPTISEVRIQGTYGSMDLAEGTGVGEWGSPYVTALIAAQLTVAFQPLAGSHTINFSWEIIEHKAQTVYPVLVSIAAELITLAWPVAPSVDADISITVVEYL